MAMRYERVRCGKSRCRCMRPGVLGHGPYWYEYWREGDRTRKRYWGRKRPSAEDFRSDEARERASGRQTSYDRARMAHAQDLGLLGLAEGFSSAELRRAYRAAALRHHPDRGGDLETMKRVNAAYERLRKTM